MVFRLTGDDTQIYLTKDTHMIGLHPDHGLDDPTPGLQPPDPADIPDDTRPDDPGIGLV